MVWSISAGIFIHWPYTGDTRLTVLWACVSQGQKHFSPKLVCAWSPSQREQYLLLPIFLIHDMQQMRGDKWVLQQNLIKFMSPTHSNFLPKVRTDISSLVVMCNPL